MKFLPNCFLKMMFVAWLFFHKKKIAKMLDREA